MKDDESLSEAELRFPYCHVPSTSNFATSDHSLIVINNDQVHYEDIGIESPIEYPIHQCTEMVTNMFSKKNLGSYFHYDTKKRRHSTSQSAESSSDQSSSQSNASSSSKSSSSTSTDLSQQPKSTSIDDNEIYQSIKAQKDSLPQINIGFVSQDTNEYGSNLVTIGGNVKPSMTKGGLSYNLLQDIVEMVELILELLPDSAFGLDNLEEEDGAEFRREFIRDLRAFLTGKKVDSKFFRVEGITILIPISIAFHRDIMNDLRKYFDNVVSINVQVPVQAHTKRYGKNNKFYKWLRLNGYTDSFPCSFILYSRKSVGSLCAKLSQSISLGKNNKLYALLHWALVQRVGSVVDYRSSVFHNESIQTEFARDCVKPLSMRKRTGKRAFKSKFVRRVAAYDRIVSSLFISKPLFHFDASHYIPLLYNRDIFLSLYIR